jgi:hypothetical protein
LQPWGKWDFATKGSLEEREHKAAILEQLYSRVLPKVGGAVVGMEGVRGAEGGPGSGSCLMLQWQKGSAGDFWVGGEGEYPYLTPKVLRRLGMKGTKAMHALVCELLRGPYERKYEKVVVDGVEVEREVGKVVMHTCGEGGLKRRGGRWTCCIHPLHLEWGTVRDNVMAGYKRKRAKRKGVLESCEKARVMRWAK